MIEIETKIKIKNREELISKVDNLKQKTKNHIIDIYFDRNDELKLVNNVLRLRKQNEKAYIAYKGPRIEDCNLLVREEYKTEVSCFDTLKKILESLGYSPTQTIEGIREDVLSIMKKLGYVMEDAIAKSCTTLFYGYLEKKNIKLDNPLIQFTFKDEENISCLTS